MAIDDARMQRRMELQNKEFEVLNKLTSAWSILQNVAVVEDDYPHVRHKYEAALQDFVEAIDANGRRPRGNDYRAQFGAELLWPDVRRIGAQKLVAEVLQIVSRFLTAEDQRRRVIQIISEELFYAAWKAGVYILTDADRASAGLPPRGALGWTDAELQTLENRRLEAMLNPMPPMIFPSELNPK
jgi:hypothetical protein